MNTYSGLLQVTYREHSVLITGFEKQYIYVNDPLTNEKNRRLPKEAFVEGWIQLGRQASTFR